MSCRKEKTQPHIDSKTAHRQHDKTSDSEVANGADALVAPLSDLYIRLRHVTFFANNKKRPFKFTELGRKTERLSFDVSTVDMLET